MSKHPITESYVPTIREREREWRGKNDTLMLQWYTPPIHGGHRQIFSVSAMDNGRYNKEVLKNISFPHYFGQRWFFETLEELLEADRREWKERTLDTRYKQWCELQKIRFE